MSSRRWRRSGGGQVCRSRVWGTLLSRHQPGKCILSRHPTFEGGKFQKLQTPARCSQVGSGGWAGSWQPPLSRLVLPLTCQQHGLCGRSRYLSAGVPCQVGQVVPRVQILPSLPTSASPAAAPSCALVRPPSRSQQARSLLPLSLPPFPLCLPSSLLYSF